jgi:hypothetical protein
MHRHLLDWIDFGFKMSTANSMFHLKEYAHQQLETNSATTKAYQVRGMLIQQGVASV